MNYPAEARPALAEMVTIDVKEQSIDTIIAEVVKGTDWTWELTSDHLNIRRRK